MACIDRRPRCGTVDSPIVAEPIAEITALIGGIAGFITTVIGILKFTGSIAIEAGSIVVSGTTIGAIGTVATLGSVISGVVAALAIIGLIIWFTVNRCSEREGLLECVAGVVNEVVQSFSTASEEIFPFTAMHDRVDLVVKHKYWDVVENGNAFVHCTNEITPRRSEIMRVYYFSQEVCNAAGGAIAGAVVGAVGGVIAGAAIGAAIGCATVIFCLLALILAAIVAAVAALVGAFIGGQIAKAVSDDTNPSSDTGDVLSVGDYVSIFGPMVRTEFDSNANVLWWETSTLLHGSASAGIPSSPFSYCEVEDELTTDSCPLP